MTNIVRKEEPNPAYPRNGNVNTQKPGVYWVVYVNGRSVGRCNRLKDARLLASDFEGQN